LHREKKANAQALDAVEDSEQVVSDADKGPGPYNRLPSSTATLKTLK
jgi:hypothetical protein